MSTGQRGIATTICLQPIYQHLGYKPGDLPETDRACETVLSLPIYPELTDTEQKYVVENLKQSVRAL